MGETKTADQTALEYGFRWFEFHAQQRTTTFNFYLIIYSGLVAAEAFLLKEEIHLGSIALSLIMILTSVLFWQLDIRNRQLVGIGETIVSHSWLANGLDDSLNPVARSAEKMAAGFRYKELFGAIFAIGGIAGVAAFGYAMYLTHG